MTATLTGGKEKSRPSSNVPEDLFDGSSGSTGNGEAPKARAKVGEARGPGAEAEGLIETGPDALDSDAPSPGAATDEEIRRELAALAKASPEGGAETRLHPNGEAIPPVGAPEAVQRVVEAGNMIARSPYRWGGGHGRWLDNGYDCSGSVSFALYAGHLLENPMTSGTLMRWGAPGRGRWITVYANPGHVFMVVGGLRFDTSGRRGTRGSRWQPGMRGTSGYVVRHPPGL